MTFTKERLIALSNRENVGAICGDEIAELARIALASREAEPVAWQWEYRDKNHVTNDPARAKFVAQDGDVAVQPLFTAPPAPASVPDDFDFSRLAFEKWITENYDSRLMRSGTGYAGRVLNQMWQCWLACRAALLQGAEPVSQHPELTVWYGSMPETNGKTNWTAILHRKGECLSTGITIERSEYPERVKYEADRVRHIIGELKEEPDILAYDADAHSGYVKPGNSPAIPDDVRRMDWLVSKTVDVREPMVYGSYSLFWSQTITDEEDDYHATKLREQIDAAMAAENAAAPQQGK